MAPLSLFLGTWKTRYTDVSAKRADSHSDRGDRRISQRRRLLRLYGRHGIPRWQNSRLNEATFNADGQAYPVTGSLHRRFGHLPARTSRHTLLATVMPGMACSRAAVTARVSTDGIRSPAARRFSFLAAIRDLPDGWGPAAGIGFRASDRRANQGATKELKRDSRWWGGPVCYSRQEKATGVLRS